jgi:Omp85 superfamily domain/WD40-like Beta Propeller Repeat
MRSMLRGLERGRHAGLRWIAALAIALCVLGASRAARAGDPYIRWYSITTPHFVITFSGGLEPQAEHLANLAEDIYGRLVPELGWAPSVRTQILLTDDTDSANGSETALPYNQVRLYVTAPDDMSPLDDYDDWFEELLTHEYTHVLHTDNISGIPAVVNAILGKTVAPNQAQPRWILEGLAVAMETRDTGGGRLRSSQFDMYLRADVLSGHMASIDQISNPARRWPGGNLWYLYGSEFVQWIEDIYGLDTYAAVAADYGANIIPWGINRSIEHVTGRTYVQLYAAWKQHLLKKYGAEAARVRQRGLRVGTQLTHRGEIASSPRFAPRCAQQGGHEAIFYVRDDGNTTAGIYRVPLASRSRASGDASIVTRMSGTTLAFDAQCGVVFDSVAPSRRYYDFDDLFRQPRGTTAPRGLSRLRQRLTTGLRAREPNVSADGRHIVFVTNHAGTTTLRIADFTRDHRIVHARTLVPSARYEQAFTPRFSPDGRSVAYSAWTAGGYRDVRIVDVATGRFYAITHDRAIDQQPTWSPDGHTVFFTSDRTGIANVYAFDIGSHVLHQVTNVLGGAYMPEISPDERTLFYIGYTHRGYDLFSMPLQRDRWLPALPYVDQRPASPPEGPERHWKIRDYNPLPTLGPHAYSLSYGPGTFGQALQIAAQGSDIVGLHSFSATLTVESQQAEPAISIGYAYHGLPFVFRANVFRRAAPRHTYRYGDQNPLITEIQTGASTGVVFTLPGEFDAQTVGLSYTVTKFDSELPVGTLGDPYAQVTRLPDRGYLGLVHLGYSYSNAEGTTWGISPEKGFSIGLSGDFATPAFDSDSTLTAFAGYATLYVPMPWAEHHVLAFGLSAGTSAGTYPRRGLYYTGGFADTPVLDAYTSGIEQSGFVLRGYAPAAFIGSQYNLANAEYRFPILYPDHGISTLPVFLRSVSGVAFADYGGAFDTIDPDDPLKSYHLGVGGELWVQLTLGYFVTANIRVGYAHGVDDAAAVPGGQTYVVAAAPF